MTEEKLDENLEESQTTTEKKSNDSADIIKFKGKYIYTIGRRKTAVAQVRLYKKGSGVIVVNAQNCNTYFSQDQVIIIKQPLKYTKHLKDLNYSIIVKGGGKSGQAEGIRNGIARSLIELDPELRPTLKAKGWLKRDDRKKERKKPGLKKARRAPQWSKR